MINLAKNPIHVTETLKSEPQPFAIDGDGKKCWKIKSIKDDCEYKIWAMTFAQALEHLPFIEDL